MTTQRPTPPPNENTPAYVLPQWETSRRRWLLDRRVRAIRRSLIAGGLVGTVAFTALAGYESKIANGAAGTQTASVATTNQTNAANMFTGQESTGVSTAKPSPTATATAVAQTKSRTRSS